MKLPAFFIVGNRPVKAVATEDGGMDVQAYVWETRQFDRDMSYLSRITAQSDDVEEVAEDVFERHVDTLRRT